MRGNTSLGADAGAGVCVCAYVNGATSSADDVHDTGPGATGTTKSSSVMKSRRVRKYLWFLGGARRHIRTVKFNMSGHELSPFFSLFNK